MDAADARWVTISRLAELRGITRQSASERVSRLEQRGALITRFGKGRAKLVNLDAFDRAVDRASDPAQLRVNKNNSVAAAIVHVLEQLPQSAEDITAAVAASGAAGARALLRSYVHDMRVSISKAMSAIAEIERQSLEGDSQ